MPSTSRKQRKKPKKLPAVEPVVPTVDMPQIVRSKNSFVLLRAALNLVWRQRKVFAILVLLYAVLSFVLVRSFSLSSDYGLLKQSVSELFNGGSWGQVFGTVAVLTAIFDNSAGTSPTSPVYQSLLILLFSLMFIRTLRLISNDEPVRVIDILYRSSAQFVPATLYLAVIGVRLIPAIIGTTLFNITVASGFATSGPEQIIWSIVSLAFVLWSVYLVVNAFFGVYIIALPNTQPLQALAASKKLIKGRYWYVVRRLLLLPVVIGLGTLGILLIFITIAPILAEIVFMALSATALLIFHAYHYRLYRELVNE